MLHSCYLGAHLGGFPEPIGIPKAFAENVRRGARAQLEELGKRVVQAGLPFTSHVCEKPPVTAILDEAEECNVDLIVIGTRDLTGLKHVLLGSVAERTVRLAECPVATVKADR